MELAAWLAAVGPVANGCAGATGLPPAVILSHWHLETGGALESGGAANNLAGITDGGPPAFQSYADLWDFATDYVATLRAPAYRRVLAAAALGRPIEEIFRRLGESPWDAGGYGRADGRAPGYVLLERMWQMGLEPVQVLPAWAVGARQWAMAQNITDGTRPEQAASRAEVMVMLARSRGVYTGG